MTMALVRTMRSLAAVVVVVGAQMTVAFSSTTTSRTRSSRFHHLAAFVPNPASIRQHPPLFLSDSSTEEEMDNQQNILTLQLEKPLGIILEEMEEGQPSGVKVEEIGQEGSAQASGFADQLLGLQVATVMGEDVTNIGFDDIMDKLVNAPSPVAIGFLAPSSGAHDNNDNDDDDGPTTTAYEVGQTVTLTVIQEGKPTVDIQGLVGENLRQTLLDNDVEVYRGLKKKLGNCGGAGQCTFCAVDFVDSDGWEPRSEYEDKKIGKYPSARLACLNNIQGPATIRVQ